MSLRDLCHAVQAQWRTLVRTVWPATPAELSRDEGERLSRAIRRRWLRLVALRGRIDRLLTALGRRQQRLRELSARLLTRREEWDEAAWLRLQQAVARRRERAERLERRYERECEALDRLRRARRGLEGGELVVVSRWVEEPAD
jgi:chromosome segregation ATPase